MEILKRVPWWGWAIAACGVAIAVAVTTGAGQALIGAFAALLGSGMAAHRANRKARTIDKDLTSRLEEERAAVDDLNQEQAAELAAQVPPTSDPPTSAAEEAARRDAVKEPWQ